MATDAVSVPTQLTSLVQYLEGLTERASVEALQHHLNALQLTTEDLQPFIRFGSPCYQRNLICEGEFYELLCICWQSGQRSPIHNHPNSTCGVRVMEGIATETIFDFSPSGQAYATGSEHYQAGFVCASQDEDTHQISNLQASGENLITLHIYSPALRFMDTFSIMGERDGVFRPKNVLIEHSLGGGI